MEEIKFLRTYVPSKSSVESSTKSGIEPCDEGLNISCRVLQ